MTLCKLTSAELKTFTTLVEAFNNARLDLENFLNELQGGWVVDLESKSDTYQESPNGQAAQERIDVLDGWLSDIDTDFDPDLSEVS